LEKNLQLLVFEVGLKDYLMIKIAVCKAEFNGITTDERIATQRCSTGVTKVGIKKKLIMKN